MKRIIAIFLIASVLIQNVSEAFVIRDMVVTSEKIIPFSFVSENQYLEEDLSIKGLNDVKIKGMYVDNGKMTANIDGSYIEVNFSDGEWANNYKTIDKIESMEIDEAMLTDESKKTIIVTPNKEVKSIQSVSGDFSSAKINSNKDIEITVGSAKEGTISYDEKSLVKEQFTISIDKENSNRNVKNKVVLPYEIQGKIIPKSGDTSAVQDIYVDGNEVTVEFDNGVPIPNETTVKSGYTYVWIDRNTEGIFYEYNPNSVYSTDINKITGTGEYISEKEFEGISISVENDKWQDYCGIEKDGVRHIYVFDKSKGVPKSFLDNLIEDDHITFDEQNFNSEKYSVIMSNTGVSYIPEGKLYSMGELVKGTYGWGEVAPNRDWESKKTFFNELTGKYETYVKHFKFFYGPKEKTTFGGYYTYPYSCVFEYQHYKPVRCYSGEVVYEYESREKVRGYSYNGWVKIEYKAKKNVNDYPPSSPINVRYNALNGNITWEAGKDDYTSQENLIYEIQIHNEEWRTISKTTFSELLLNYKGDSSLDEVRIRTIDEAGQESDWAYTTDSCIELTGSLKPYIVKPGDSIDIFANTKSLEKVQSVIAKNDEMQMYTELQKTSETTPNFFEISFDIEAVFPEDIDEYFNVEGRVASGDKQNVKSYRFKAGEDFDTGSIDFEFTEDIKMTKNGTLIFSNLNYDDIPLEMTTYDSKTWFVGWKNKIYIKNKISNKEDMLIGIESGTKLANVNKKNVILPEYKLTVNKFEYDETGKSTYEYIDVDKKYLPKPWTITWNTDDSGITSIFIYSGNELIYKYKAKWEDINKHVDNFNSLYMYKQMKKFSRATYGYVTSSTLRKAKWHKIVLNIAKKYDLRNFTWLGYRVKENEYVKQQYVDEYNSNPAVRNNYRLLISDDSMSNNAIKSYTNILKTNNISMTKDKATIFGDDAIEYTSAFHGENIKIPENIKLGKYEIKLIATDVQGNISEISLTLLVQDEAAKEEERNNDKDENPESKEEFAILDKSFGRFFYKNEKGFLEEMKKTRNTDANGFVCAGETIGIVLATKGVEYIEIDFSGDESIKTLDYLTKKFLIDIPEKNGKDTSNIEYQYMNFSKKIYPQYVDNQGIQIYKWFYVIPYKTAQTLESWSTLKSDTLENIDETRLFERISDSYSINIYPNGMRNKAIHLPFDVFERWDTVLNRDITEYVVNSDTRWEMRIDK